MTSAPAPAAHDVASEGAPQARLRERAAELFPGGVNSPVRAFRSVGRAPLIPLDAAEALAEIDATLEAAARSFAA